MFDKLGVYQSPHDQLEGFKSRNIVEIDTMELVQLRQDVIESSQERLKSHNTDMKKKGRRRSRSWSRSLAFPLM